MMLLSSEISQFVWCMVMESMKEVLMNVCDVMRKREERALGLNLKGEAYTYTHYKVLEAASEKLNLGHV